jgi:dephospho-CoA kinase
MLVIGLTGGIGSGKTAVSDRFKAKGITVVDADVVAREVVEPGTKALVSIAEHFGADVIQADGALDRAALRKKVFQDEAERKWLEKLLHPAIGEAIFNQLAAAKSPYAIFVSPLLIETSQLQLAERILVVDVPIETQIQRTMTRDSNDEAQVKAIIAAQATREQRLVKAHDVIVNDQGLAHLDTEVERLHQRYLQLANAEKSAQS